MPGKKRERPASSSSTEVPTASRNQRSWATRITAASRSTRYRSSHSSEAMSRWLVGSSSSSRSGSPASARASEARVSSPPEKVESWRSQLLLGEAEPVQRLERSPAPIPAARMLEPLLRPRIAAQRRGVIRMLGHRRLQPLQLLFERHQLRATAQYVVPQRQLALPRRTLVVQRDPRPFLEHQLAAVDRRLPGDHPQQRRLARTVASRQRHPIPPLELERDATDQRIPRHVLVQPRCDHHCHLSRNRRRGAPTRNTKPGTLGVWAV